jgi:hypothetical protein
MGSQNGDTNSACETPGKFEYKYHGANVTGGQTHGHIRTAAQRSSFSST